MYTQPLFDYAVFSSAEKDARGRFICAQCPKSSDALRGVLGKTYM